MNSVRVNCVYVDFFEFFEASKYSKNLPPLTQC